MAKSETDNRDLLKEMYALQMENQKLKNDLRKSYSPV